MDLFMTMLSIIFTTDTSKLITHLKVRYDVVYQPVVPDRKMNIAY